MGVSRHIHLGCRNLPPEEDSNVTDVTTPVRTLPLEDRRRSYKSRSMQPSVCPSTWQPPALVNTRALPVLAISSVDPVDEPTTGERAHALGYSVRMELAHVGRLDPPIRQQLNNLAAQLTQRHDKQGPFQQGCLAR